MKVRLYCDVPEGQWNDVCETSDQAWLFHRHEWIGIEVRHSVEENHSFAIVKGDGQIVGIHPLYLRNMDERLLDSGLHRHTGLALRNGLPYSEIKAARALAMNHIFVLARHHNVDRIQLNSHNLAPQNLSYHREEIPFWVTDYGFYMGLHFATHGFVPVPGMTTCCADQIVRLEKPDEATLFRNLEESCQRAVRKAQKCNLKIAFGEDDSDVQEYYELALASAQRTGESLPAREYYQSIVEAFGHLGKCRVLFALHEAKRIGALFLLIDKKSVNFMAGVSLPDYLHMRVNDFMHWSVMKWAREEGYSNYRLGPVFPEVDAGWPISKVSRFKKKFGGRHVLTIQGSFFLKPEKYLEKAQREISVLCQTKPEAPFHGETEGVSVRSNMSVMTALQQMEGLPTILSHYGLIDFPFGGLSGPNPLEGPRPAVVFVTEKSNMTGLGCRMHSEPGKQLYYASQRRYRFWSGDPVYHALLPHTTFSGDEVEPLWVNDAGHAVIAWYKGQEKRTLLIGLDAEEEIVRHRQGDPEKVGRTEYKGGLGFDFERPNYLFDGQVLPRYRTLPWADCLGFCLAETLAQLTEHPLVEPLPEGAKGLVILTGDDDQAYLEKYDEQLKQIGQLPITYFLHPKTRHTAETLKNLLPQVELGVHPDALDHPEAYDRLCTEQVRQIRQLAGRAIRTVRNHGFLNRGYLGHLEIWEQNGLTLDVNYPGVDGTALNASFLPMRVRRPDKSWSTHYSLLTLFGDGMIYALRLSPRQAARQMRKLANQIEKSHPGVMVLNFHPQNIGETRRLHEEALVLARRPGWIALGLESYLEWLELLGSLRLQSVTNHTFLLTSPKTVTGLVLRYPTTDGWRRKKLTPWSGKTEVHLN